MSGIPKRFIGQLDDANIAAGAAIATSKFVDGAKFVKNDGSSSAATASQDMGNNKIVNLATPTTGTDATNKSYVDTLYNNFPNLFKYKDEVKAAMITNVTVSNPGTAVFDGVTLSVNDRLLLTGQTAPAENGLYIFNGSGVALTRSLDADTWNELVGMMVTSYSGGTANGSKIFFCTNSSGGTLGTTSVTYTIVNTAGLSASNFVGNETVSGTVNGSNVTFTLANTPVASSEAIFIAGYRLIRGTDYTISTLTITMTVAPLAGEVITADYRK